MIGYCPISTIKRTNREQVLRLAHSRSLFSARQVARLGIHTQLLSRLVQEGKLERVYRGRYRLPEYEPSQHHSLALVAAAVPHSTVCLLSPLSFHGLGSQIPFQVWIAIDRRARRPSLDSPPLRVVRFTRLALTSGVEMHSTVKLSRTLSFSP